MIHLNNVSYTYEKGGGVSNINMSIGDDECAFLIGPTGSGKTTLLRLIYMDLLPQVGNVVIDEYDSSSINQKGFSLLRGIPLRNSFEGDSLKGMSVRANP